jgi:NDP-sugar pyrophosphorylase family protein
MSLPVAILAGGLGTRLGELTRNVPKALVPVNGEPFLAHQLRLLHSNGIRRVVMCIGHHAHLIQEYVGDGSRFGLDIDYSIDGPVLLGTAGALRVAAPKLGESFLVVYGDSYLPCDYEAITASFLDSGKAGLMTVFHNQNLFDTSNVEFSEGRILVYDKRHRTERMQHIDYGLGAFHRSVFESLPADQPTDLAGVYQNLLAQGDLAAYEVNERFYEIGSIQGLRELEEYLR